MIHIVFLFTCLFTSSIALAKRFTRINLPSTVASERSLSNWHNLSPSDSVEGIGTEKTYSTFGVPSSEDIVVAVIDGGINVNHEDLQGKVWINEDEIPNNGLDDDHNGFIDDVFGWNFVGNPSGMAVAERSSQLKNGFKLIKGNPAGQVQFDNSEMTREVIRMKKLKAVREASGQELSHEENLYLQKIQQETTSKLQEAKQIYDPLKNDLDVLIENSLVLKKEGLFLNDLASVTVFVCMNLECDYAKKALIEILKKYSETSLRIKVRDAELEVWTYREDFFPYDIVNDDQGNISIKHYGNNDVIGSSADHGTMVAGLIGAERKNNFGILGVAENVKIMAVKVIPAGDGRTKDIANGILYAVDNGAKIINISLASDFETPYEYYLDEAIRYAEEKDVLIVHSAGNESIDLDFIPNYPNRIYEKEAREFSNWIAVGSTNKDFGKYLNAPFSNYGKVSVDILAPGLFIYTATGEDSYESVTGTSMSAPLVAGAAAVLLSYEQNLTVKELRELLVNTSRKYPGLMVKAWGDQNEDIDKMPFSSLAIGGILDLFEAVAKLKHYSLNATLPQ